MDPIEMLIDGAVQHEVLQIRNPYLSMETIIIRLYRKIADHTRVSFYQFDKTILFSLWHEEILTIYESLKSNMSYDERASVERVLSKDTPHPNELTKFACCWHKYDPVTVCRWFAVDGILGTHPKAYVLDAFSLNFEKHNNGVRVLYNHVTCPEKVKQIVERAFNIEEPCTSDLDPEIEKCVGLYIELVGQEEIERVASDRRSKLNTQQPNKRKKKSQPVQPFQPISPVESPQND